MPEIKTVRNPEILMQNAMSELRQCHLKKASVVFIEALEALKNQIETPDSICLKIELQVIIGILPELKDLYYIKNQYYERARMLFGLFKFHQDAENCYITNMDEARSKLLDALLRHRSSSV